MQQFIDPTRVVERMLIAEGMQVADFGAGSGVWSFLMAERVGPSGKVYALDIQRELVAKIANQAREERVDQLVAKTADIDERGGVSLPEKSLDLILLANVLFQLEKKEIALTEAHRLLSRKGRLVIVDWEDSFGGIGPSSDMVVPASIASLLAEEAGFSVEPLFDPGSHHYALVARPI